MTNPDACIYIFVVVNPLCCIYDAESRQTGTPHCILFCIGLVLAASNNYRTNEKNFKFRNTNIDRQNTNPVQIQIQEYEIQTIHQNTM